MASLIEMIAGLVWLVSVIVIALGLMLFIGCIIMRELELVIFGVCAALVVVGSIFCVGSSKVYNYYHVATNESTLAQQDIQDYDIIKIVYVKGIPDCVVYADNEGQECTKILTAYNIEHATDARNHFCITDSEYKNEHNVVATEHKERVYLDTMDFYKCKYHTANVDIASMESSE